MLSTPELRVWIEATAMNVDRCMSQYANTADASCVEEANLYAETLVGLTRELTDRLLTG